MMIQVAGILAFWQTSGAQTVTNYTYTGATQTFTVPAGITTVTVTALGASGGLSGGNVPGGSGATLSGSFSVSAGDVLTVFVGGRGSRSIPGDGGYTAAGGGGGSAVVWNSSALLLAAGGGGGGGRGTYGGGGLADTNTVAAGGAGESNGGGGGGFGFTGGNATGDTSGTTGGGAASLTTFSVGGTGSGSAYTTFGGPGGGGFGGGGAALTEGGGGGGGYAGGMGATGVFSGGSVGGESYFDTSFPGTLISATPGTAGGGNINGQVTISYSPPPPAPTLSISTTNSVVTVYWPNTSGWSLLQNGDLTTSPGSWSASSSPTLINGTNYLNVTNPAGNVFFILQNTP